MRAAVTASPARRCRAAVRELAAEIHVVVRIVLERAAPSPPHRGNLLWTLLPGAEAGRLTMKQARVRRVDDPVARLADAQTEIDVVEIQRQPLVEPAHFVVHRAA